MTKIREVVGKKTYPGYVYAGFIAEITILISAIEKLERHSVFIGELLDSVDVFATNERLYMVTTPVSLEMEDRQKMKTVDNMNLLSVWPAPSVFISAVGLNVKLLTSHVTTTTPKIFILSYCESPDSIECKWERCKWEKHGIICKIIDLRGIKLLENQSFFLIILFLS